MAKLLREDARLTMPATPSWFAGRDAIMALFASWLDPGSPAYVGEVRRIVIGANQQPACAGYLRRPGDSEYRPLGLEVLRIVATLAALPGGDSLSFTRPQDMLDLTPGKSDHSTPKARGRGLPHHRDDRQRQSITHPDRPHRPGPRGA